jgi:biopolymer transport protein ExbB
VFAIVRSIGWPIWPLILASLVALALIIERGIALRRVKVLPANLLPELFAVLRQHRVSVDMATRLERHSPLGQVLAAGLRNADEPREFAAERIAQAGGRVAHDLSRHLSLLGSIGSVAPLLGLLGTVVGMIEIFASQQAGANPQRLASGISIALYSTAFGIIVAVPAVMFYRYYKARVEEFIVAMEDQSERLLDFLYRDEANSR